MPTPVSWGGGRPKRLAQSRNGERIGQRAAGLILSVWALSTRSRSAGTRALAVNCPSAWSIQPNPSSTAKERYVSCARSSTAACSKPQSGHHSRTPHSWPSSCSQSAACTSGEAHDRQNRLGESVRDISFPMPFVIRRISTAEPFEFSDPTGTAGNGGHNTFAPLSPATMITMTSRPSAKRYHTNGLSE